MLSHFLRIFILLLLFHVKLFGSYETYASSASIADQTLDSCETCRKLFDNNGNITHSFKKVFEEMKAPQTPQNLSEAFGLVQGKTGKLYTWLRKGERFDPQADDGLKLTLEQAQKVINFCVELGFFQARSIPDDRLIKGILIQGSTLSRMRAQVTMLNEEITRKPWLKNIPVIFMAGERILASQAGETPESLYDPGWIKNPAAQKEEKKEITDEREMVKLVKEQLLSPDFKTVDFVLAKKQAGKERATTMDVFEVWFSNHNPEDGSYVLISSNPFITYQELVATEAASINKRPDVTFIGCGPTIDLKTYKESPIDKAKILLDNLARIIYEMKQLQEPKDKN